MKDSADDTAMWAAIEVVAAVRHRFMPAELKEDVEAVLRRERKKQNFWTNTRRLLGVFEWRYLFLPIGIQMTSHRYFSGMFSVVVHGKQLHIFGVRVARWVTHAEYFRDSLKATVPIKRYKPRLGVRPGMRTRKRRRRDRG